MKVTSTNSKKRRKEMLLDNITSYLRQREPRVRYLSAVVTGTADTTAIAGR